MNILPTKDRHYLKQRDVEFEEIAEPQKAVVIRGIVLPQTLFDTTKADFLIMLPAAYPDCAPDMFYALPWLRLVDSGQYPKAADQPFDFAGKQWQRWSRHNNEWRPAIDGIWTMIKRVEHALMEAA